MKKLFGDDFNDSGKKAEFYGLFEKFMAQDEMTFQYYLEKYLAHINHEKGVGQVASSISLEGPFRVISGKASDEKGEVTSTGPRSDNPCGIIVVEEGATFVMQNSSAKNIKLEGNNTSAVAMHKIYNLCQRLCVCSNEQERVYLQEIIPQLMDIKMITDFRSEAKEYVFNRFSGLKNNESIIIPTGYTRNNGDGTRVGHAIYVKFTKDTDGKMKAYVFNAGAGYSDHHRLSAEDIYPYEVDVSSDEKLKNYAENILKAKKEL